MERAALKTYKTAQLKDGRWLARFSYQGQVHGSSGRTAAEAEAKRVRIPSHSVHPFRSNPYTDSDVFVHPLRRNS